MSFSRLAVLQQHDGRIVHFIVCLFRRLGTGSLYDIGLLGSRMRWTTVSTGGGFDFENRFSLCLLCFRIGLGCDNGQAF